MSTPEKNIESEGVPGWAWTILIIICLILTILGGLKSCNKKEERLSTTQQQSTRQTETPLAEGTTPCKLPVGWGTVMKTGGLPVLVKYHGKTEWIRLSGRENDKISLDQFAPGDAEFASPPEDRTPVRVEIYPPGTA